MLSICTNLAEKIVDATKQICGYDINFIDKTGIIVASTNQKRINEFHQAGLKAIQTKSTIIVNDDETYLGAKKGINIPIFINEEPIAVIGVTGEPEDVSKYIILSTKITEIFLNENFLKENLTNRNNQISYIVQTYLYNQKEKFEYTEKLLEKINIENSLKYHAIVIVLNQKYNLNNISFIEKNIKEFFEQCNCVLNTYIYPFEFIGFICQNNLEKIEKNIKEFALFHKNIIKIGIGDANNLENMNLSYKNANIAISYIKENENFKFFEDFSLEILLNSIPKQLKEKYLSIIEKLSEEEINVLNIYFQNNMELKKTSSSLFMHTNTLQYKLDKINKKIGLNPRLFQDAHFLYTIMSFL